MGQNAAAGLVWARVRPMRLDRRTRTVAMHARVLTSSRATIGPASHKGWGIPTHTVRPTTGNGVTEEWPTFTAVSWTVCNWPRGRATFSGNLASPAKPRADPEI